MEPRDGRSRSEAVIRMIELGVVCATFLVTLVAAIAVYRQTTRHFALERSTHFIERFNGPELVTARETVDSWLKSGEEAGKLFKRAEGQAPEGEARVAVRDLRTFTNFFQELGTAMKHGTLDEEYVWDVFGGLVVRYGDELQPFVREHRRHTGRMTLYSDFDWLIERIREREAATGVEPASEGSG